MLNLSSPFIFRGSMCWTPDIDGMTTDNDQVVQDTTRVTWIGGHAFLDLVECWRTKLKMAPVEIGPTDRDNLDCSG